MAGDLTELRGEGWKRLFAAARRDLERTGGALDRSIGLNSPTDAERRLVIGITGSYRPQTVKRLTIELVTLDAALRQGHGAGLHDCLVMLGGPLRNPIPLPVLAEQVTGDTKALLAGGSLATLVLRALAIRSGLESMPRDRLDPKALRPVQAPDLSPLIQK
ncbi:MAG TPA: TIGR02679 domain-containing protein [Streptosporangiaceae bacterium]|nr:TIGR02679 domain-containing protein [Streptosporangiaceae bacterium]